LGLLDTAGEPGFDRITRLACAVARVPIALICLVDAHRQWIKSRQGLDLRETERAISFCGHAILADEPLIVPDARADARFAGNPLVIGAPFVRFYAGHPIHAPGGARVGSLCVFDTETRLLSPLEGAALADLALLVDAELERAAAELREHAEQQKLRESSHQAGMAEIATNILHSVGNVANSLGIASATIRRELRALRLEQLAQATALIRANRRSLPAFFTEDVRGRHLPDYLAALSAQLSANVQALHSELDTADELLEQLQDIVSAQHTRARAGGWREPVDLKQLLDATITGQELALSPIQLERHYEELPVVTTERHKLTLILVNIINNARDAVLASTAQPGRIAFYLRREGDDAIISIEDSGVGMLPETLPRIWRFGFTTKSNGQGFDLHNSANAAREIGATVAAHSDGPNKGSRFTVRLPIRGDRG
jgi:signal transduction histidine kinase